MHYVLTLLSNENTYYWGKFTNWFGYLFNFVILLLLLLLLLLLSLLLLLLLLLWSLLLSLLLLLLLLLLISVGEWFYLIFTCQLIFLAEQSISSLYKHCLIIFFRLTNFRHNF